MAQNYDVGTRAWQPDPTEGWVASVVEEKRVQGNKVQLIFQLANGEVGAPVEDSLPFQSTDGADARCCDSQGHSRPRWLR